MQKFLRTLALMAFFAMPWASQAQNTLTFDFEDGNVPATWNNDATYPWVITNTSDGNGHNGVYCIKSSNSGVSSSSSTIQATFTFTTDGSISFLAGIYGEGTSTAWDKCIFMIDGEQQFALGALAAWNTYSFEVSAGEHTFAWRYTKDSSVDPTGDCFYIDDLMVELTRTCFKVTSLTSSNLTANGVTLTWADVVNTGATYTVMNGGIVVESGITGNTYDVTGLTGNTDYTLSVVANCSAEDASMPNTVSFRTPCDLISTLPYEDGFENNEGTSNPMPYCWTRLNDATSSYYQGYPYSYSYSARTGSYCLYLYTGSYSSYATTTMAVMPGLDVTAYPMNGNMVTFWARNSSTYNANPTIEVGSMSDPTDASTFVVDSTLTISGATYTKYVVKLNKNSVATNAYVAFRIPKPTSSYWGCYIDDVVLEQMPSCWPVTDLALGTVTNNSVQLTWNANEENVDGITYSVYNGETLVQAGVTSPYTVTGLQPLTTYTFSVVANCAANDPSAAERITVRTACPDAIATPFYTDFEDLPLDASPECWKVVTSSTINVVTSTTADRLLHDGTQYLDFRGAAGNIIALPVFDQEISALRLSFWSRPEKYSNSSCGNFSVGYMTDVNDASTYVEVAEIKRSEWEDNEYHFHQVVMPNAPAGARMAMCQKDNTSSWYWFVDEVTVEAIPHHTVTLNYLNVEGNTEDWGAVAINPVDPKWGDSVTLTSTPAEYRRTAAWYVGNHNSIEGLTPIAIDTNIFKFRITQDTNFTVYYGYGQFRIVAKPNQDRMGSVIALNNVYGNDMYDYATVDTFVAVPATGFKMVEWLDKTNGTILGTTDTLILEATRNYEVTARFNIATYTVAGTVEPANAGTIEGANQSYMFGSLATLTAVPEEHYTFSKWSDDLTVNPRSYRVLKDSAFTALFEPKSYTVTVLGDNNIATYTGAGSYKYNTEATIKVSNVDENYTFDGWTLRTYTEEPEVDINGDTVTDINGDTVYHTVSHDEIVTTETEYTFTVDGDMTFVPNFIADTVTLTIASMDIDMGTVSFTEDTLAGLYTVSAPYMTTVEIRADTAGEYSHFTGWSDGVKANPRTVTLTKDSNLVALFSFTEYAVGVTGSYKEFDGTVTTKADDPSITLDPAQPYFSAVVTLTANAPEHWVFDHWTYTGSDEVIGTETAYSEMLFDDAQFTAHFVRDTHTVAVNVADATHGTATVTSDSSVAHGANVTVAFTNGYGYTFHSWSNGATDNPYTFALTSDTVLTALVDTNAYQVLVEADATEHGTASTTTPQVKYLSQATLAATPAYGYLFSYWADKSGNKLSDSLNFKPVITTDTTFVAHFIFDTFTVTGVAASDYRMMGKVNGSASVAYTSEVVLTAVPKYGYTFAAWVDTEGNAIAVDGVNVIEMGEDTIKVKAMKDTTFYATFDYATFTVTAGVNDPKLGDVAINGTVATSKSLPYSSMVNLEAIPAEHYHFVDWNGDNTLANPYSFLLTMDTTFVANFAIDTHNVVLSVDSMYVADTNITGTGYYDYDSNATVTFKFNYGYTFTGWADGDIATTGTIVDMTDSTVTRTIKVASDTVLTPVFTTNTYTLTAVPSSNTMGTLQGVPTAPVEYLSTVTLKAIPEYGYDFVNWTLGTEVVGTASTLAYTVTKDADLVANFVEHRFVVTAQANDSVMGTVEFDVPAPVTNTTVADGTSTTSYVPVYGINYDSQQRTQSIYPESMLTALVGKNITSMKYYIDGTAKPSDWYSGNYTNVTLDIKLAMTTQENLSSGWDNTATTTVFTGQMADDGTITFDNPFTYTGGNLLVSFVMDNRAAWKTVKFYAQSATGASRYVNGTNYMTANGSVNNYLPKVTFGFELEMGNDPVAIDPTTGNALVQYNASVAIKATANEHYDFVDWTNAANEHFAGVTDPVTGVNTLILSPVTSDSSITANFTKETYTITVASNDALKGTVAIVDNDDLDTVVPYLDTVMLTATPAVNHRLLNWKDMSGNVLGNTDTLRVAALQDSTITAYFVYEQYALTVNTEDTAMGGVYAVDPNNVAPVEDTVADGTENNGFLPIYGTYMDTEGTKGQSIYPASMLTDMNGTEINAMTYYLKNKASKAWTATVTVKLTEVNQTSFASSEPLDVTSATTVYTGTINGTANTMVVTLDQPYTYNGGNLLVDFTVTTDGGNYTSASFYGATSSNASYYEYQGWSGKTQNRADFLPKVTFTCTPSAVAPSLASSEVVVDYNTLVNITATAKDHYHFVGWQNAAGDTVTALPTATETVTVLGDSTLTALFDGDTMLMTYQTNFAVRGSVNGPDSAEYNTEVQLTAVPAHGYQFVEWSDHNTDNPRTVTVKGTDAENTYKAIFNYMTYNVAVSVTNGTVSVNDSAAVETFHQKFFYSEQVELALTANEHHGNFKGWSDGVKTLTRTLTVLSDTNLTAQFDIDTFTVDLASNDATLGVLTGDTTGKYTYGTELTFAAQVTAPHTHFEKWSDNVTDAERTLTVVQDTNLTAIFVVDQYNVVANVADSCATRGTVAMATVNESVLFSEDFEGGVMPTGWTNDGPNDWTVGTGDYSASTGAHAGTNNAKNTSGSMNQVTKLITPAIDLSSVESANLNFWFINRAWAGDKDYLKVYYRAAATDEWTLIPGASYTTAHATWTEANFDLTNLSATYQLAFEATSKTGYGIGLDDVTINGTTLTALAANTPVAPLTKVAFTATPAAGALFHQWQDGNTDNPRVVVVDHDTTMTASFEALGYQVVAAANFAEMGSIIAVKGTDTVTLPYNAHLGDIITLTAVNNHGYHFVDWSTGATTAAINITVAGDTNLTANFDFNTYTLNAVSSDPVRGTVTGSGSYSYGSVVNINAAANEGYIFKEWNDGNTENPRSVVVSDDTTFTATFRTDALYTITVNAENGTVSGNAGNWIEGDVATLYANANNGYEFVNWTDAAGNEVSTVSPFDTVVYSNIVLNANFAPLNYTVTLVADPAQGTVTGAGTYAYNSTATISATANDGFAFTKWSDDVTTNPRDLTVTGDVTLTAIFTALNPETIYIGAAAEHGQVAGAGNYNVGTTVTLTATPDDCYEFVAWTKDGVTVSEDAAYSFVANESGTYMATFTAKQFVNNTPVVRDACGTSFTIDNNTFYASGDYTVNTTTLEGCDSTYTLTLTLNVPMNTNQAVETCGESYYWQAYDTTITEAGVFTHNFTDANECPAVATLTVTFNSAATGTTAPITACDTYTWIENGVTVGTYTASNNTDTYTYQQGAANGCDSIVTLNLTINYSTTAEVETVVETGDSYTWNNHTYYQSGIYYDTISNVAGCDSIRTLALTLTAPEVYYTVTVLSNDNTMGTVDPSGEVQVLANGTLTVTATPAEGYQFVGWSTGSTTYTTTLQVNEDGMTITAYFEAIPLPLYTVSATANIAEAGTVVGSALYEEGSNATLYAQANTGYRFTGWSTDLAGTNIISTDNPYLFTVTEDVTLYAIFVSNVGIDETEAAEVTIFSNDSRIVIRGAENQDVYIFDVNGRTVLSESNIAADVEYTMANTGVYLVKVGNAPAKRVLVIR